MKKLIASGTIKVNVYEDEYEGNQYNFLEIPITDTTIERTKLKAPSSYELLVMKLNSQTSTVKINSKPTE